tara:strand:+ start:1366 stop:1839 length:474 start_codon:yes stop_codon:yes gene_type:complete
MDSSSQTSADFITQRNSDMTKQAMNRKKLTPRLTSGVSAKAVTQPQPFPSDSTVDNDGSKKIVDKERTVEAIMEAVNAVGEDFKNLLNSEQLESMKKAGFDEKNNKSNDDCRNLYNAMFVLMGFVAGYMIASSTKKQKSIYLSRSEDRLIDDTLEYA